MRDIFVRSLIHTAVVTIHRLFKRLPLQKCCTDKSSIRNETNCGNCFAGAILPPWTSWSNAFGDPFVVITQLDSMTDMMRNAALSILLELKINTLSLIEIHFLIVCCVDRSVGRQAHESNVLEYAEFNGYYRERRLNYIYRIS